MFDTKKGKYSDEENEQIIQKINEGIEQGRREREILKELSTELNRGFAGIMSHVRKLRNQYPERFASKDNSSIQPPDTRLNSWTDQEEDKVIQLVNQYTDEGKPLSAAIMELEKQLNRTQGAIYQRIYTLRRKYPERFNKMPEPRPRRRRKLEDWQIQRPVIRSLDGSSPYDEWKGDTNGRSEVAAALEQVNDLRDFSPTAASKNSEPEQEADETEESMVLKAFESRYGHTNPATRDKLFRLMKRFGHTRVSIALFTLPEDKEFPATVVEFLEKYLEKNKPY
ncbi:hypothetical protein GCM10011571_21340 [Marinithermofilum abyssi]|uniref:Uncharacterized protein n=1 Tax=Marinithermofilum abyssi TaxID=1571185 RepID=A0A8J2VI11_9BACL|nr:hypothetical protein [Marinithermofilum abyssi]GGE19149.1 hypothetical protein GCM10011571_21340 [Marinithermofilum abyssi]